MTILYKFASRSRPEKFITCVENIYINSRNKEFTILASLDLDDKTMNNEAMIEKMKRYEGKLYPVFGVSKNKVAAINRDMDKAPKFDVLINMSDDMMFIAEGYDRTIEEDIARWYPDGDCLLHYPDQNQGSNCMTMSIMDKKYYDRFGYIYNPDYESLECDLEAQEVGKRLGRYKFINKRLFNHYHPSFGQTPYDNQYDKTEGRYDVAIRNRDKDTYIRRESKNFYL
ncbi:MAG: hypothetical protein A2Z57_04830 [Planctomycetes bacterium RIFCSPHIGHO2_12_39_6]|nr:MAG: hypothetical protein A2Z57_04830 [Planctomycetes bacterium RIFCSPHIGHO2_12_39_6]